MIKYIDNPEQFTSTLPEEEKEIIKKVKINQSNNNSNPLSESNGN